MVLFCSGEAIVKLQNSDALWGVVLPALACLLREERPHGGGVSEEGSEKVRKHVILGAVQGVLSIDA